MSQSVRPPGPQEIDCLLLNAELRDLMEPFMDESITCLDLRALPTDMENEYLASMLAWERAPTLPISEWFDPPFRPPHPDQLLSEERLRETLWDTIHKLYEKRIVLDFTDHLDDRQLYRVIYRDILPSAEKMIDSPGNFFHWDCSNASGDPEVWLRYYASEEERRRWAHTVPNAWLPPAEPPPHPRAMPRRPL